MLGTPRQKASSAAAAAAAHSGPQATAAGGGEERPSIEFTAGEIKDALGVEGGSKSPRKVPMAFTSLMSMSPRKSSTGTGASPRGSVISFSTAGASAAAAASTAAPASPQSVSPTPAPTPVDAIKAEAKREAEDGAGSLPSPGKCWDCVSRSVSRLCGETVDAADDDELVVQPVEHQLVPVFRKAGIPAESADIYLANLRSQGYDNVLALRHLAQDRFKMSLAKYVPDRADRKRLLKALEETLGMPLASTELPALPASHLPIFEWVLQFLSVPQDTALRYTDALRGLGVHTGEQLLQKSFGDVEPALVANGVLQGHRKAFKALLKQRK